jgi:arylamine N-acetyltransferase
MKRLVISLGLLLSACATTTAPVMPKWPAAPADLQQPVPELTTLSPEQRNLSDVISNANENYSQYYILKEKYEGWQNWYKSQQQIWQGLQ